MIIKQMTVDVCDAKAPKWFHNLRLAIKKSRKHIPGCNDPLEESLVSS